MISNITCVCVGGMVTLEPFIVTYLPLNFFLCVRLWMGLVNSGCGGSHNETICKTPPIISLEKIAPERKYSINQQFLMKCHKLEVIKVIQRFWLMCSQGGLGELELLICYLWPVTSHLTRTYS